MHVSNWMVARSNYFMGALQLLPLLDFRFPWRRGAADGAKVRAEKR